MKSFDQWFRDASIGITEKEHEKEADQDIIDRCDPEVADHNLCGDGEHYPLPMWTYPCRICDHNIKIADCCDIDEFTADMSYCGRSPSCMP